MKPRVEVDAYHGSLELDIGLVSFPGRNGLDLDVRIHYSSAVYNDATKWNYSHPTGVLGLGWSLPAEGILAVYGQNVSDVTYYFSSAAAAGELVCTGTANGTSTFQLVQYRFWQITYTPASQSWTVIREDGTTYTYGGTTTQNAVQWGVCWGNWRGASAQTSGWTSVPVAFNLVQASNRFGDTMTWSWQAVSANVPTGGTALYTQAAYLSSITGVTGESVTFTYASKTADATIQEYVVPHQNPVPPNAWQDRYQTQYLASLAFTAANGTPLYTQVFTYSNSGDAGFLGTGGMAKRLLTGIQQRPAQGAPFMPGLQFVYCGQSESDAVSATTPYNATTQCLYGALKSLTTAEGGTTTYTYTEVAAALSPLSVTMAPPVVSSVTMSQPLFYFEDLYVVATWLGSNNQMYVSTWIWDDRWLSPGQSAGLDTLPVSAAAYATTPVSTSPTNFAIYAQNQVHLYAANAACAGLWILPSSGGNAYFTTTYGTSEAVELATGDGFAAALGLTGGVLSLFRFTSAGWVADPTVTLSAGLFALGATGNSLLAISVPQTNGPASIKVTLYVLSPTASWLSHTFTISTTLSGVTAVAVNVGDGVGLITLTAGSATNTETYAVAWNGAASSLKSVALDKISTSPLPAPVLEESTATIGTLLYRFDGVTWNSQNVGGTATLQSSAVASDVVITVSQVSSTSYNYSLWQWNPNSASWSAAVTTNQSTGGGLIAATNTTQGANLYAVVANTLYVRQPDQTWTASTLTIPALTGPDASSLVVAGDRFVLYQQSGDTTVVPLENGAPLTAIALNGVQVFTPGVTLAGTRAFITYSGTFGSSSSTLTLYRYIDGAVTGANSAYVISSTNASNGYQTIVTGYNYDASVAIADQALTLRSNFTTVTPGNPDDTSQPFGWSELYYFNGMTAAETPALPYPSNSALTNATSAYTIVAGLRYDLRIYTSGAQAGSFTAEEIDSYWVFTQTLGTAGTGHYVAPLGGTDTLDGVSTTTVNTFDPDSGLLLTNTVTYYNSLGASEQRVTQYAYFWRIYDPQNTLNLLTPVVQVTTQTIVGNTTTVTGMYVTTYNSDWGAGDGQWAPQYFYTALSGSAAAFTQWSGGPAPSGWLLSGTILAIGPGGVPQRVLDVDGTTDSMDWDVTGTMPVASFRNADTSTDEACYYGFHPYETPNGWGWQGGQTLGSNITTAEFHTGVQSLQIPGTTTQPSGPFRVFHPGDSTRIYVFGFWMKTFPTFNPANGAASFTITVATVTQPQTIGTLTITVADTNNAWALQQQTINVPQMLTAASLPATTLVSITIAGSNQNSISVVYVDNLRFSPVDCTFAATVFDPAWRIVTATVGNNGETSRLVYDAYNRIVATIGPGEIVMSAQAQSLSCALSSAMPGQGAFVPDFPNTTLALSTTSSSAYYDFHQAGSADWTFNDAGGTWAITEGALTFTGTTNDPLGSTAVLQIFAFTNFAVRVVAASVTATAGVGNGDAFVTWDASNSTWSVLRRQASGPPTTVATSTAVIFDSDWTFVIVEGLLLFFAGGTMVFAVEYSDPNTSLPNYGQPALLMTGQGTFDDLIVLDDPQLSLRFQDGFGETLQTVSLVGNASGTYELMATGTFLDQLGRAYVARKPARPPLALATNGSGGGQLIAGNQSTYLVTSSGRPVTILQYLAGRNGFDFTRTAFEASPLSRLTAITLPREAGRQASNFTIMWSYGAATAAVMPSTFPSGVSQNYPMQTITDQDGVVRYRIFDALGRTLANVITLSSGVHVTASAQYDAFGNVTSLLPPNYFTPPGNSTAATWQETRTFTFNRLLQSRTTPDSGMTQYLYDLANRLRFVSTAAGAATSPPTFVYYLYDTLGRCIEEGYIQSQSVTWTSLAAQVNVQSYPQIASVGGRWIKRYQYDVDSQGNATNSIGRLVQVLLANNLTGTNVDSETFTYDDRGNVLTIVTSLATAGTATYTTTFTYDNQDHISTITYPQKSGESAFQVGYFYDRLGRLAAVGQPVPSNVVIDPANPASGTEDLYAAYSYNASNLVTSVALNNATSSSSFLRTYTYDEPGWLTGISDPFFTQTYAYYEQTGYSGAQYNGGVVAASSYSFAPSANFAAPPPYSVLYGYDPLKRLTAASSALTALGTDVISSSGGYDANGNILTATNGPATTTYSYQQSSGQTAPANNRLYAISQTASVQTTFNQDTNGWSWGASNGGPSSSAIITAGGSNALQLAGGSLDHFEFLQYAGVLPAGTYNLAYTVVTAAGGGTGDVGWYLSVNAAAGPALLVPIGAFPTTTGQASISNINVPSYIQSLGGDVIPVTVSLQLRNYSRSTTSTAPGGAIALTNITFATTTPATAGPYTYDANGNVLTAPALGITATTYDPDINQPRQVTVGGTSFTLGYDATDARLYTTGGGVTRIVVRDHKGKPLRVETQTAAGTDVQFNVYGQTGLLGVSDGTEFFFVLDDLVGSTRLLVNTSNEVVGGLDYQSFGAALREYGNVSTPSTFTGQQTDPATGLYDFPARLYDPYAGRFHAPDVLTGSPSPYIYAASDPVRFVDPDGRFPRLMPFYAKTSQIAGTLVGLLTFLSLPSFTRDDWSWQASEDQTRALADFARTINLQPLAVSASSRFADTVRLKSYDPSLFAARTITGTDEEGRVLLQDSSPASGYYIYTLDEDNDFRIFPTIGSGTHWEQLRSHSQLAGGKRVYAAGWLQVDQGKIVKISPDSGHYMPNLRSLLYAEMLLRMMGAHTSTLEYCRFDESVAAQCTPKTSMDFGKASPRPAKLDLTFTAENEYGLKFVFRSDTFYGARTAVQHVASRFFSPETLRGLWWPFNKLGPGQNGKFQEFPLEAHGLPW